MSRAAGTYAVFETSQGNIVVHVAGASLIPVTTHRGLIFDPQRNILYITTSTGTVERSVEIRDYRVSVGAGLRITVPMLGPVPIALDLGFPLVKGPNDHEQVFSFWVGFFR